MADEIPVWKLYRFTIAVDIEARSEEESILFCNNLISQLKTFQMHEQLGNNIDDCVKETGPREVIKT